MIEWDDLRHFLAVAETGTTLAAARRLRVSQTTSARRVAALEAATGLRLFDRRPAGYQLTADGNALVAAARDVAAAVARFEDAAEQRLRAEAGTIRVTASDVYAVTVLAPVLRDFHAAHPEWRIDMDSTDAVRDLASGADIALRVLNGPPEGSGIVGRPLGSDPWTFYCSRAYADAHGVPATLAEAVDHPLLGGGEAPVWEAYREFLAANGLERAVTMRHGNTIGLLSGIRAGHGIAILPCFAAEGEADLVRCGIPRPSGRTIWLLAHEARRSEPRVRALLDFLYARLAPIARAVDALVAGQERGAAT